MTTDVDDLRAELAAVRAENDRLRAENKKLREVRPLVDVFGVMAQDDAKTTTVIGRIKALGVPYSKRLSWAAGTAVRLAWQRGNGTLPAKALTTKASGHGVHCHAHYPVSFRQRIDEIVLSMAGTGKVQGSFAWADTSEISDDGPLFSGGGTTG